MEIKKLLTYLLVTDSISFYSDLFKDYSKCCGWFTQSFGIYCKWTGTIVV